MSKNKQFLFKIRLDEPIISKAAAIVHKYKKFLSPCFATEFLQSSLDLFPVLVFWKETYWSRNS